ncbi:MAG: threonyl-tRNA synthetase [Clostridia bacterium]|jgi:threonyl-tRNA synthetase|nr:threonyl-tRNA synthetase [Clostridia bacterium]
MAIKYINNKGEVYEGEYDVEVARHTTSHILAGALKRIYGDSVKLAIGPTVENGFYYDVDSEQKITEEDLEKIEAEMNKIIKENLKTESFILSRDEAIKFMKEKKEDYKVEIIEELPENSQISFFKQGEFVDLCVGPHLLYTKGVKAFKLMSITGAYWRGSEKNKMLTRIYGTAFESKEELENELEKRLEAKRRDHNKLGRELELFTTVDVIGQGLPLLMPKGATIFQTLQRFVEDEERRRGYLLTKTPLMAKSDLYKLSGHWDHYKEGMFVLGDEENDSEVLALRPMTCPFQFMIFKNKLRSYKDLPYRYNETSTLFRNESSGEMHGLTRVRQFTLSEGHLVVRDDQVEEEFKGVISLINYFMDVLNIREDITYRFSKWDPNDKGGKYIDNPEAWEATQIKMKNILDHLNIDYVEAEGEAAFYGPKLDIQTKNVYGKEDTLITVQLDFALAESLDMSYVDKNGEKVRPVIIHRSSIGSYERTIAMLTEKYAGAFPLWLSPVQVKILPITENELDYSKQIEMKLQAAGYKVEVNHDDQKIGYKIREAISEKVPYMIILGKNEIENNVITVRDRKGEDIKDIKVEDFIKMMDKVVKSELKK